ncbi:hypothetical protein BGW80DRAFT_1255386 [Lactifluus volemus]|nr:hypothetical protein BGW80DRAFT_1255386 [Lactifluus volemus]
MSSCNRIRPVVLCLALLQSTNTFFFPAPHRDRFAQQGHFLPRLIELAKWVWDDDGQTKDSTPTDFQTRSRPQTLLPNCLQAGKMTSTRTFPLSRKIIDNMKRRSSNSFWRCRAAAFYLSTCPAEPRCIVSTTSSYGSHMYRQSRLCSGSIVRHVRRRPSDGSNIAATITSTQKHKPTHQRQPVNGRRKNIKRAEATKPITSWVSQFKENEPVSEPVPPKIAPPTLPSIPSPPASRSNALSFPLTPTYGVPTQPTENTSLPSPSPSSLVRLSLRQQTSHPPFHAPYSSPSVTVSDSHRIIFTGTPPDQPPITSFASLALGGERFGGWGTSGAQLCPRPIFYDVSALTSSWVLKPQTGPSKEKEISLLPAFTVTVDDPQNLKVGDIRGFAM